MTIPIIIILALMVFIWDLVEITVRNTNTNEVLEKKRGSFKFNKVDKY